MMEKLRIFLPLCGILYCNLLLADPEVELEKQLDKARSNLKTEQHSKIGECIINSLSALKQDEEVGVIDKKQAKKLYHCLKKEKVEVQPDLVAKCVKNSRAVFSIVGSIGFGVPKEHAIDELKLFFRELDEKKLDKYKLLVDYLYSLDSSYVLHNRNFHEQWFVFCMATYD